LKGEEEERVEVREKGKVNGREVLEG